jgi:hypothetical protein
MNNPNIPCHLKISVHYTTMMLNFKAIPRVVQHRMPVVLFSLLPARHDVSLHMFVKNDP